MLDEIRKLEPQLKQILYSCLEDIQATKAALYVSASEDLNDKKFEVATSYQYNVADRRVVSASDELVDRMLVRRDSILLNGLTADRRFSEMLFKQGNDRLLAVPFFSRGRMVGFIDMRDKAANKPFQTADVEASRKIADAVLEILSSQSLFGIAPIAIVEERLASPVITSPSGNAPTTQFTPNRNAAVPGEALSPLAKLAVETARQQLARRQLAPYTGNIQLAENELELAKILLPAALAIPGAVLASLCAVGHPGNPQLIVTLAAVPEMTLAALQVHLQGFLARTNVPWATLRTEISTPFGARTEPIAAESVASVLSAPVNPHLMDGVVLTVAFERVPDASAQRSLEIYHHEVESAMASASSVAVGSERQAFAERILEPDFQKFPDLAEHSRQVAALAQRFARLLELPPAQVENIRLAALLHDVGFRLLDYDRLYKKKNLTADELRALTDHPVVGAAILEPIFGGEIANLVLRHHERADGKGYPSKMPGTQVPVGSKVIQLCDAWIAMTSTQSYQAPLTRDEAKASLRENAGTQFDAILTQKFLDSLHLLTN